MKPAPLTELLSAAYVAAVIEADNMAEQRIAHRHTDGERSGSRVAGRCG